MHRISNGSTAISNVFQLISKFLSKMVESGVLKTFTFLYSENHPYVDKNLENMIDIIEELKAILIKVCAGIQPPNEPLMEHQNTYHILSSASSIDTECVRSEEPISYPRHTADEFSFNEIHNTIERNIQLIAENESRMCDDLDHSFSSQEITTSSLKSTEHTMFSECSSINSLLKEDQNDFLQDMRFNSTETSDRTITETNTVHYNQHVQYSQQCENTLQNIDLDILNRSNESYQQPNYNERINPNFDRIFDDQFPENESLLESECWNDINLPSTEPITSGIEIQASPFELNNLKSKIGSNLDESLVSDLDSTLSSELSNTVPSVPTAYDINKEKHSDDFDQNKFFCEHCGDIFDTKLKLKIHLKRKHNVYVNNINRCDQCGKVFKKRATLLTHTRIHSEIKPYKCPYCWKTFTQKITRDSHVQLHTGSYKFSCQVCEKRFPTQAKLNFHSKCHEKPELRCEICSKMFTTKQYLNLHKKVHFKPNPPRGKSYSCTECSVLFYKKRDLLVHIKDSHPEMKFMCYFAGCSQTYSTYKRMIDHVYKKHSTKSSCENDKKTDTSKLHCTSCRISFVEKSSYFRHNLLVHRENLDVENSFNCVHCEKRFTTESSLDDHLEKFHNSVHSKEMNYSCSICGSLFYAESALKEHYKIHSDYSTHLCQTCGMVFSEKANFLLHQSVHDLKKDTSAKKFQCETCDSRFENKMELRQHELDVHNIVPSVEELKPYPCSYCDKRFTTKGKCNLHMETHGKERNYKCTKCDKRFFRRDLLKEHMKTHNSYRAYVCKICGLAYSQKSSLKTHEKTHEKVEESISCEQCQKIFHSKQALNFHLKTHDGVFRFACEVCGKKFIRKCHYDLHLASHSVERPFKCLKCPASYKTNKHLREHSKKMHQNEPNFSSLFDSIYTEDEVVSQQNLLDEYIPSINPLQSELIFDKAQGTSF